jgi:PAS domain-containing protein
MQRQLEAQLPEDLRTGTLSLPDPLSLTGNEPEWEDRLAARGIGLWECDLRNDHLRWSAGVYDLFGLPRGMTLERGLTLSLYSPASRPVMEELRAHAIRHRRGFTVDVELRQPGGDTRWMRLSAMPILERGKAVRLRGLKIDVTAEYDCPHAQNGSAASLVQLGH